jgi:hypothetical protein
VPFAISHDQFQWLIAGDDLPGGAGLRQLRLQPLELRVAEHCRLDRHPILPVPRVRAAIASLVQHEDLGQRTVRVSAEDALGIVDVLANRQVVEQRSPRIAGQTCDALFRVRRVGVEICRGGPVVEDVVSSNQTR